MIETLESYWSAELGETVDIIPVGEIATPYEYGLWVGGTFITAYKHVEEIENYLGLYFMVKGDTNVG